MTETRAQTISAILEHGIIAIARGIPVECIAETAQALYDGGIRLVEVTFNQASATCLQDTARAISILQERFGGSMHIGAGTVLTPEQARCAYDAGAAYIISPNFAAEVVAKTRELGMVSIPAALTPTEIVCAHRAGADFVKLFPAGEFGLSYIKAVAAPLNHIPMLAVGGVSLDNLCDFFGAGIKGVGLGSNLVSAKLAKAGEFGRITATARSFTEKLRRSRML